MSSDPRDEPSSPSFADLLGATLSSQAVVFYEALAERLGLNPTDLRCLELIRLEAEVTPGRLAELTGLTTGAVTGVLDRLEKAGIVRRDADPEDRRRVMVRLVPGQAAELAAVLEPLAKVSGSLLDRYAPNEQAAIKDYLARAASAVQTETQRLRAIARGGFMGDTYTAPLAGATRGRLVFVSGGPRLSMNVAPLGASASARIIVETAASRLTFMGPSPAGELINGRFEGPLPDIRAADGAVTVRYRRSPFSSRAARLALSDTIPWTVEIEGGITDLTGTLEGIPFAGLELRGGGNHVTLDLPAPLGTVTVRILGVASSVSFRRPTAVPVALSLAGGISHLRLDDRRHQNVDGSQRFETDAFATTPDRYEIQVLGGASDVRIGTR